MPKFERDLFEDPEPLAPPPEGWQPVTCTFDSHQWGVEIEEGKSYVRCLDPCDLTKIDPSGKTPVCAPEWFMHEDCLTPTDIPVRLVYVDDSVPSTPMGPAEYGFYIEVYPLTRLTDEARAAAKAKAEEWNTCSPSSEISAEAAVQIAQAAIDALSEGQAP